MSESVWMRYLELLYAAHPHHVAVIRGPYLRWTRYMSCVLVSRWHGWRRQLCRSRVVGCMELVSSQLREAPGIEECEHEQRGRDGEQE